MQKLGDAVILMNKSEIRYLVGNDKLEVKPFPIYSDMAILLLDTLSRELRNDKEAREYPDILTFAFWCRRANITKLKEEYWTQHLRIGRGLIFHIAPSNVPINFAFSLAFGILAGNANVVRVSEKDFPQTKIVCRILKNLLENPEFTLISKQTQVVSYGHIKDINDYYSHLCDVRIIWGGDTTIETIRHSPIGMKATEITFADRFSFAVFDEATMERLTPQELEKVGEKFYNDTYLMDQNACSSPHLILWKASERKVGRKNFWNMVVQTAQKYDLSEKKVLDKYTILCEKATEINEMVSVIRYTNLLYVVGLKDIPERMDDVRGKFGLFYEADLSNMEMLCSKISTKMQTCVTYGIDNQRFAEMLIENHALGIDRIVPVGQAMNIGVHWDGYDVIGNMSREIVTIS
ncbi:MAG: hypothetical protein KHY91_02530 [Roseburia sp.]|nr:hypothetical protein [Roseburia sp.]